MNKTTNYGLNKPDATDFYNIEDFNGNADIVDSQLKKDSDRISILEKNITNPNLLINSNFKVIDIVNQRGLSNYDAVPYISKYTIDQFQIYPNYPGTGSLDLTGEYLKLVKTSEGGQIVLMQTLENFKYLAGKKVTFTAKVKTDLKGQSFIMGIALDNENYGVTTCTTTSAEFETHSITIEVPNEVSSSFAIKFWHSHYKGSIELEYLKLEVGELATNFVDDDISVKLEKCRRYFLKTIYGNTPLKADQNQLLFIVPTNTEMRTNPTVKFMENVYAHNLAGTTVTLIYNANESTVANKRMSDIDFGNATLLAPDVYTINNSNSIGNTVSGRITIEISAEL